MTMSFIDRRGVLKAGGALTLLGSAGAFATQLAAAGEAAAQAATNYKALVCIYMFGGNDAHNTLLATDTDSWGRYFAARNIGFSPIALMPPGTAPTPIGQVSPVTGRVSQPYTPESWGGVLPIVPATSQPVPPATSATPPRTFALHPFLGPLQTLFNSGRLAVVANVGPLIQPTTKAQYIAKSVPVPTSLFSHFDQQGAWQGGTETPSNAGWGGAMGDYVSGMNGANTVFTAIAPSGNAAPGGLSLFLSGLTVRSYAIATGPIPADVISAIQGSSLLTSNLAPSTIASLIQPTGSTSNMINDYGAIVSRSINAAGSINTATAAAPATNVQAAPAYTNPFNGVSSPNSLAQQLQAVAQQIANAPQLGVNRQVFFVSIGPFDTHHSQNLGQPDLLGQVAQALAYFDSALSNIGGADLRNVVTTFTASDFGRSFTMNDSGTDHGWGSHHFVMGAAVKGGDIYGQYPTIGVDAGSFYNPDIVGSTLIPKFSVDQYAATLGTWFGVSDSQLAVIFPNLKNFDSANLGFV